MTRTLLLLLALAAGCGGPSTSEPTESAAETSGAEATASTAPRVQLDVAGEGERLPLRYRFESGVLERGSARMTIATQTSVGGSQMPNAAPPAMLMDFTIQTTERVGGAMRYRYQIDRVSVDAAGADPAMVAQIEASLAPLARIHGDAVVDELGRVLDVHLEVPPDLPPELASSVQTTEDMMRQMVAPLPVEPVAVGAEWKTETTVTATVGLQVRQRTFYRLVSRDGDRVVLDIRVEQAGVPGPMAAPQPGVEITLLELAGRARGTSALRLDRMMPEHSEMQLEMSQDATITAEGQTVPMHMDMQMSMAMDAR